MLFLTLPALIFSCPAPESPCKPAASQSLSQPPGAKARFEVLSLENCHLQLRGKTPFSDLCLYFTWRSTHSTRKTLSPVHLLKIIRGHCLPLQLPEGKHNLKQRPRKWESHRWLWKALTYSWESKRLCTYRAVHVGLCSLPGKVWEHPTLSPLNDLEALHSRKWRLRQNCKK